MYQNGERREATLESLPETDMEMYLGQHGYVWVAQWVRTSWETSRYLSLRWPSSRKLVVKEWELF